MGEGFQKLANEDSSSNSSSDSPFSSSARVAPAATSDMVKAPMNYDHDHDPRKNAPSTLAPPPPLPPFGKEDFKRTISCISSTSANKMQWSSIWIAAFILFLVAVQFSIYFASLWPYMSQIDPTADQSFYGFTLAAYSAGQMISSPVLGFASNRLKRAKPVIALGVSFAMVGNVIYLFAESVPNNQKWVIMGARFICGLGGGNAGTIRGYIATASTLENRARAVAIGTAALSLGVTAGPILQACVTPIGYPGLVKGPFHLSQYTAPAYVSFVAGLVLLTFLFTKFKENYVGVDERKKKNPFHYVPKYDRLAVGLCILCWFVMFFCVTNTETVESPYTMAVFNWTNDDAVYYNSLIMAASSFISFTAYMVFAVYAKRINERVTVLVGLCMLFSFYAITFPWPFFTGHLDFKSPISSQSLLNSSNQSHSAEVAPLEAGCDPWMEWCRYTPRLPLPVYLAAYPLVSAGFPACNVAISTLFSKVIGPRRQGFLQSLMIMCGSGARLLGPILISWLFDAFGPRIAWTMTAGAVAAGIFLFTCKFDRLVPLKMRPGLKSGQKIHYDGGTLHRF